MPAISDVWEVHLWAPHCIVRLTDSEVWHWLHAGKRSSHEQSAMLVGLLVPDCIQQLLPCIAHDERA